MLATSSLVVCKFGDVDTRTIRIWNNLIRATSIVNGEKCPTAAIRTFDIHAPLLYSSPGLGLKFINASTSCPTLGIMLTCGSGKTNHLGGVLEIVAATTSALEYVIGREDCLDIESWEFSFSDVRNRYQDVGVDSITSMTDFTRDYTVEFLEEYVESKLDEIEKACL